MKQNLNVSPSKVNAEFIKLMQLQDENTFTLSTKFNENRIKKALLKYNNDGRKLSGLLEMFQTVRFNNGSPGYSRSIRLVVKVSDIINNERQINMFGNNIDITLSTYAPKENILAFFQNDSSITLTPLNNLYPKEFIKTIESIKYELILVDKDDMYGDKPLVSVVQKRKSRKNIIKRKVLSFFNK